MDEYYKIPRVSSSSLSSFDPEQGGSPAKFKEYMDNIGDESKESKSMYTGRNIHLYCEDPDKFVVDEVDCPSDAICELVEMIHDAGVDFHDQFGMVNDSALEFFSSLVNNGKGIYQSWSEEKRLEKIKEGGKAEKYYMHLENSRHHIMLSKADKIIMENVKESIQRNDLASTLLFGYMDRYENRYKEQPILWKYPTSEGNLKCKSLVDNLHISLQDKKVILNDIKTTSYSVYDFIPRYELYANRIIPTAKSSFLHYKYYRQMAFYALAVSAMMEQTYNIKISPSAIEVNLIVIETVRPFQTKVFKVSDFWIDRGLSQLHKLLTQIKWHQKQNYWEKPKEEGQFIEI